MTRRSAVPVGAFLAWTIFVWGIVRVRNILGDDAMTSSEQTRSLLLSASLWIPAAVLLVVTVVAVLRHKALPSAARIGVALLGVWTVLVWMVRAYGIALAGDHAAAFIAVHLVLAVISVGLAVLAARALRPTTADSSPQPVTI